jgi:hypothetical protein
MRWPPFSKCTEERLMRPDHVIGDYSNIGSHASINLIQAEVMAVPEGAMPETG